MYITWNLEHSNEKVTNFNMAEAVVKFCDDPHESCDGLNAETVAKMILLQKGGDNNAR